MPSTSSGRPPSPHSPPSGRGASLLSRIKAPFGSKTRHVSEFYIQPDDPHRQYSPGDVITGSVILKILKPLRVTHIVVCLHGFVQVYKGPNNPGDSYRSYTGTSTPGKTNRTGYFGNGFASLFQDEVTLCGEGRLGEGTYQFGYELVFPKDKLPTSIDFERGTIAYMVTATITKPTTISPTTICDRKVQLVEDFDITTLRPPKARVITLEPLNRRGRGRHRVKKRVLGAENDSSSQALQATATAQPGENGQGSQPNSEQPMSPAPSETSIDTCMSSGGSGSARESVAHSVITSGSSKGAHHPQMPIQATIELQRQGFLRGDTIQLQIFIQHRKLVKSLHGIIVTLYRQARVDMHPALPIVGKEGQEKSEDYYPTSKTGLGGLSLSSAGSSHVFRKDLSQSFASLIINPETLTADVKAAVRVPEEAFPTISGVTGGMISFKYYVEVVLDLHGKLSGLDRLFPTSSTGYGPQTSSSNADAANGPMFTPWGGHLIDTQEIRREKGIVSCVCEVVIGTRDSQRIANQRTQPAAPRQSSTTQDAQQNDSQQAQEEVTGYGYDEGYSEGYQYDDYNYQQDYYGGDYHHQTGSQSTIQAPPPMHSIPLPDLTEEENLPEKERLRRAEERLLPSQPPDANEPESSTVARNVAPSAPILPGLESESDPPAGPSAPHDIRRNQPSAARLTVQPTEAGQSSHPPSAPAPQYSRSSDPHAHPPTDDKHELQRRRLEMERSAPDEPPEEAEQRSPPGDEEHAERGEFAPTAPVFMEDDDHGIGIGNAGGDLPRYER